LEQLCLLQDIDYLHKQRYISQTCNPR